MVVGKTLQLGGCAACRVSLLRTFTSIPLATSRTQHIANQRLRSQYLNHQSRQLSQRPEAPNQPLDGGIVANDTVEISHELEESIQEAEVEASDDAGAAQFTPVEPVPWYLQVESTETQVRPLSERQQIPELPENPPALLQPLLQQISVDLGLDDLTLLDLRKLDPPPALGANLIMVIGTTRSERHLHVSADRLCRWLRTTHHLRPDADGLIGRNELKLKLKRKAKRARLMGSANDESYDDGVRTGWVCVDVGVVDGAEGVESIPEPEDFVGFGRRTDGVRIVVQMLTEEKRAEVNLEKLWGDVLERGGKMDIAGDFNEGRLGVADSLRQNTAAPKIKVKSGRWDQSKSPIISQVRSFHSSAKRSLDQTMSDTMSSYQNDVQYNDRLSEDTRESIQRFLSAGEFQLAKEQLLNHASGRHSLKDEEWRTIYLNELREYLEGLPVDQAVEALGNGSEDELSTPFLQHFYQSVTSFPNQSQLEAKISLHCWAHSRSHHGYDSPSLLRLLEEVQLVGVPVGTSYYLDIIDRLLQGEVHKHFGPDPKIVKEVIKVLEIMGDQGHNVLSQDVLLRLHQALTPGLEENVKPERIYVDAADTFNLPSYPLSALQKRVHVLIMHLRVPLFDEFSRLTFMETYAHQRNWAEFWDIWRLAARHGHPRSADFYASMFVLVAATHHIKGVQTVLRHWTPEMVKEDPPVSYAGNVGLALNYCLQVADPDVDVSYAEEPNSPAEWVTLKRRIVRDNPNQ